LCLFAGIGESVQNRRLVRQPVPVHVDKSGDPVRTVRRPVRAVGLQAEVAQDQNQIETRRTEDVVAAKATRNDDGHKILCRRDAKTMALVASIGRRSSWQPVSLSYVAEEFSNHFFFF